MGTLASGFPTHFFQRRFNTHKNSRTNGLKHQIILQRSFKFRFDVDNNFSENKKKFEIIRTHITFVVIDDSERLNLSEDDYEDEDDEDFAAEEYDGVEAFYDSDDEKEEDDEELGVGFEGREYTRKDKFERVVEFCAQVQEDKSFNISATQLASVYDFPLDKFQRLAIESFLKGSSVVVCAPTSSGKTLIAEAAALATVAKGKRLLYTTPLKALSNQKFREFRETFGEKNVGLLTGDAAVNREAPILIMTTEILRNMLYQSVNRVSEGSGLEQVDFIILDEVHYLSDISRGTVWEETVIYCPKEVQLICLSATISNPEELAGWIGQVHGPTDLVTSKRRPVPLTWHFSRKKSLSPLLNQKATNMNRSLSITRFLQKNSLSSYDDGTRRLKGRKAEKRRYHNESASHGDISELSEEDIKTIRRSQVPLVSDTLMHLRTRDMLPAIWFVFSRKGCDDAVQYLEDSGLLDDEEQLKLDSALKEFQALYPEAVRENAVMYLLQGVAAHHAGCLPLWKSFIEELFQQGLIKVVFATETLAAGINMPARTTVLSTVSKRGDNGHSLLSSNALLQMAGRAGRRGIDKEGHVVLVQTPFEGAEECCKLLFAGPDPLVSQFSASYGMVLNLLAARRLTPNDQHPNGSNAVHMRRTLEEARALIEQSFGNYVSSEVMIAAKDQLEKMQKEIEKLELEISDETLYENIKAKLPKEESSKFFVLLEQLKAMRLERLRAHRQMERVKVSALKPLLEKSSGGQIHFICLQYNDKNKTKHSVPALFVGKINTSSYIGLESKMEELYPNNDDIDQYGEAISDEMDISDNLNGLEEKDIVVSYYVALGSDNTWYLFTEKWIKAIYKSGLPDVPLVPGDPPSREILKKKLEEVNTAWEKVAKSQYGDLWRAEGAIDTWSWSLNVPLLHTLSAEDEIIMPKEFIEAQRIYREGKKLINSFQRRLRSTEWYKEFQRLSDLNHVQKEKIERLKAKASRIKARISQIEPTGWRDFLQVGEVLHEAQALDINTQLLYPLGETASKIRGANELWLAMAIRNECLIGLKPSQLAAVCGSLVSEGIKVRPTKNSNYVYEVSNVVGNAIEILEGQRSSLLQLQAKHKVEISCDLDMQFAGIVEAWASGLTWREIMMDCGVDDGDLARLLRRTIDLLSQIPVLPEVDHTVQKSAKLAARMMDRTPISELVG